MIKRSLATATTSTLSDYTKFPSPMNNNKSSEKSQIKSKNLSPLKNIKKSLINKFPLNSANIKQICLPIILLIFWSLMIVYMTQHFENKKNSSSNINNNSYFWGDKNVKDNQRFLKNLKIHPKYINEKDKCIKILSGNHVSQRSEIYSQAYQEWFIYHNFFKYKLNTGIYIDMGSHKPYLLSNTALFDVCLNWYGICVEPTKTALEFEGQRSCNIARHCMWSKEMKLNMIFRQKGDVSLIIDEKEVNRIKNEKPEFAKDLFECNAIDAWNLFQKYTVRRSDGDEIDLSYESKNNNDIRNPKNNKIIIDYISLDVEKAEVEVLKCFPFDKYEVNVWNIEMSDENKIDEIMLFYGYSKIYQLSNFHYKLDSVYVKNNINFELPWEDSDEIDMWNRYTRCNA